MNDRERVYADYNCDRVKYQPVVPISAPEKYNDVIATALQEGNADELEK